VDIFLDITWQEVNKYYNHHSENKYLKHLKITTVDIGRGILIFLNDQNLFRSLDTLPPVFFQFDSKSLLIIED